MIKTQQQLNEELEIQLKQLTKTFHKRCNKQSRKCVGLTVFICVVYALLTACAIALTVLTTLHLTVIVLGCAMLVSAPIVFKSIREEFESSEEILFTLAEQLHDDVDRVYAEYEYAYTCAGMYTLYSTNPLLAQLVFKPLRERYQDDSDLLKELYMFNEALSTSNEPFETALENTIKHFIDNN